jgi:hypothetical protein
MFDADMLMKEKHQLQVEMGKHIVVNAAEYLDVFPGTATFSVLDKGIYTNRDSCVHR